MNKPIAGPNGAPATKWGKKEIIAWLICGGAE